MRIERIEEDRGTNLHLQREDRFPKTKENLGETVLLTMIADIAMKKTSHPEDLPKTRIKGNREDLDLLRNHVSQSLYRGEDLSRSKEEENLDQYLRIERKNLKEVDLNHWIIRKNQKNPGQNPRKENPNRQKTIDEGKKRKKEDDLLPEASIEIDRCLKNPDGIGQKKGGADQQLTI